MNATRAAFWALGVAFVLGGVYMLYFEAGLDRWVSFGVLMAGFLVFIGLAVMGYSGSRQPASARIVEPAASHTTVIESPARVAREREHVREEPLSNRPLRATQARRSVHVSELATEETPRRRTTRPARTAARTATKKPVRKRRIVVDRKS